MTDHPITPPPKLVEQWYDDSENCVTQSARWGADQETYIITQAARWGADQELEACCGLLQQQGFDVTEDLRATRRPKPPSVKEQALKALTTINSNFNVYRPDIAIIRRALEQLND